MDLPCEEVLSYASAGYLFDDDPDPLSDKSRRIQDTGGDATLEQFEAEVEKTYYAGKYNYMQTDKTLEQMYRDCLRKLYLTDKRNDPYSIAIVNTYLFLKEEEIYKLTTALECIRYGLTKGETLGYLGGVNQ